MAITLNNAGAIAGDPILKGLPFKLVAGCSSFDAQTLVDKWLDQNGTIPGTNSIKASLSPAATVMIKGVGTGTYNDTTKRYTISSTAGVTAGDWIYLSHGSLTPGLYEIAAIPVAGEITIAGNPLDGLGNQTAISYQIAWAYAGVAGAAPSVSTPSGQINYGKARIEDSQAVAADLAESFFIADAPAGAAYIAIAGQSYNGGAVISTLTPALNILSAWTNRGGVSHVELANHSVQAANNFQWGDNTIAEKTLANAIAGGLKVSAGDGAKYGRFLLKSKSGGSVLGVDFDVVLDTTGPTIVMRLVGN